MDELLAQIEKRCWRTAASRFESARCMKRCHNASTLCIAMLSLEIIVINLLVFIESLKLNEEVITVTTVCLSVFVLVLSLIVSQLKYDRREEKYHECGVELSNLEKQIQIYRASGKIVTYDALMRYNGLYNAIIRKWNLNHSVIDYDWAMYKDCKRNSPMNWKRKRCLEVKWHLLRSDSIYHILTTLGAVAVIVIIIYG